MADPAGPRINGVSLQEHIERLMEEQRRQLDNAASEREKAAAALRGEQSRAMQQAEREREKAASAMREGLSRSIKEGDERLREHISSQIQQIDGALKSGEKLEIQRLETAKDGIVSLRREMQLITEAAKEAVSKAEDAQMEVNLRTNEFRDRLADQASGLYPRREAETAAAERDKAITQRLTELDRRIQLLERGEASTRGTKQGSSAVIAALVVGATLLVSMVAVLANVLTST